MKFTKRVRRISIILLFALILQISPIHFLSAFVQQAFALDVSNTSGDYLESEAETQNTIEVDIPPTLIDETEDEPASSDGTEDSSPVKTRCKKVPIGLGLLIWMTQSPMRIQHATSLY